MNLTIKVKSDSAMKPKGNSVENRSINKENLESAKIKIISTNIVSLKDNQNKSINKIFQNENIDEFEKLDIHKEFYKSSKSHIRKSNLKDQNNTIDNLNKVNINFNDFNQDKKFNSRKIYGKISNKINFQKKLFEIEDYKTNNFMISEHVDHELETNIRKIPAKNKYSNLNKQIDLESVNVKNTNSRYNLHNRKKHNNPNFIKYNENQNKDDKKLNCNFKNVIMGKNKSESKNNKILDINHNEIKKNKIEILIDHSSENQSNRGIEFNIELLNNNSEEEVKKEFKDENIINTNDIKNDVNSKTISEKNNINNNYLIETKYMKSKITYSSPFLSNNLISNNSFTCSICKRSGTTEGYYCLVCSNFYLCEECKKETNHAAFHSLITFTSPFNRFNKENLLIFSLLNLENMNQSIKRVNIHSKNKTFKDMVFFENGIIEEKCEEEILVDNFKNLGKLMLNKNQIKLDLSIDIKINGDLKTIKISNGEIIHLKKIKNEKFIIALNILNSSKLIIHENELLVMGRNCGEVNISTKENNEKIRKNCSCVLEIDLKAPKECGKYFFEIFIMHKKRKLNYLIPKFLLEIY